MMTCSERRRRNGFKREESRFSLDNRKKLFTVSMVKCWNRLPSMVECILPGGVQRQAGWVFEQSVLVGGVPAKSRRVETI